jgi:hypothetical protein
LQSARSVLGEAGRRSDERVVRCVTKVRDGIPCRFIEPSSTLHPLPYRPSNLTDWRDPHNGCMPVPPPPTSLRGHDHWTMAGRRLPPYRSRASPRRKLLHSKALCRRGRGGSNRNCCGLPADIAATPWRWYRKFLGRSRQFSVLRCYGAGAATCWKSGASSWLGASRCSVTPRDQRGRFNHFGDPAVGGDAREQVWDAKIRSGIFWRYPKSTRW